MSEVMNRAELEGQLKGITGLITAFAEKAAGEIKEVGAVSTETKNALDKLSEEGNKAGKRLDEMEAKLNRKLDDLNGGNRPKSLGAQFIETDAYKAMQGKRAGTARMEVKTAILNQEPAAATQPLVRPDRVGGIITSPNRRLTIRDLLPVGRTNSNLVEFTTEDVFTNNAGPQYDASPGARENTIKPESGITFTYNSKPVITLAHWIPVSKQVLADAPMLQSFIDGRLMYGLKLEEEDELLNGTGSSGALDGLVNQATAYNRGATNDTRIDTLRKAITQGQLSEYSMSAIVINPSDWEAIELTKDNDGRYIFAQPQSVAGPRMWSLPVVATNSIAAGSFLVGAFDAAAQIWDREDASVSLSTENSDNFVRNMVTLLAEERLALTVYRASALIKGNF